MHTLINLRTLKAVALAASNEETRFYLNGVYIEVRETRVTYVATDGHVLLCVQEDLPALEDGAAPYLVGNWIVPIATIKALKIKTGRFACDTVELRPMPYSDQYQLGECVFTPIDGSFPDWRRVVPAAVEGIGTRTKLKESGYDGIPAQFNWYLMHRFHAFENLAFSTRRTMSKAVLHYTEAGSAHAVTFGDMHKAFGVIMPMRKEAPAWQGAPDWSRDVYPNATADTAKAA